MVCVRRGSDGARPESPTTHERLPTTLVHRSPVHGGRRLPEISCVVRPRIAGSAQRRGLQADPDLAVDRADQEHFLQNTRNVYVDITPPPGGNGTMRCTDRDGQSCCACATWLAASDASAKPRNSRRLIVRIVVFFLATDVLPATLIFDLQCRRGYPVRGSYRSIKDARRACPFNPTLSS